MASVITSKGKGCSLTSYPRPRTQPKLAKQYQSPYTESIGIHLYNSKQTHKGPKIVALFQGLDSRDESSGKLTDVGIFSGSLGPS